MRLKKRKTEAGQVEYIVLLALAVLALIPSVGMLTGSVGNHLCIHVQNNFVEGEPPLAQLFDNPVLAGQLTEIGAVMCLGAPSGMGSDDDSEDKRMDVPSDGGNSI
jgi:hypothetical protein